MRIMHNVSRLTEKYGKTAVVTGASDGIGKAFAEHLASRGFSLLLVARRQEHLEEIAQTLAAQHGVNARALALDLGCPGAAQMVIDAAREADAGLLIAAAGFGSSGAFLSRNLDAELAMIDLNARAVTELAHGLGDQFVSRGRGGIILMGSLVGRQGAPFAATYAATKAYIHAFGEALAVELKPHGVDVLVSAPGPVRSGFASRARMSMGATDSPEQVASQTLAALGRRDLTVPGRVGRFLTLSLIALPRFARLRIMGGIMRSMAMDGRD